MEGKEFLAISIPTRNRCAYLKELLASIKLQVNNNPTILNFMGIYIFDNDSDDGTEQLIKDCALPIIYKKNSENIDGDPNIHQAYTAPQSKYIWVIGDDELLPANAIENVLNLLETYQPALLINRAEYRSFVEVPLLFNDYQEFADFAQKHNAHLLLAHSLISANVIRKDCFDKDFAWQNIHECYSHMYGMARGLQTHIGKIVTAQEPTLIVRKERAPFDVPNQAEHNTMILKGQITYLTWLKKEYKLKDLTPERVVPNNERRWYPGMHKVAVVINFTADLNVLKKSIQSALVQNYLYLEIYILNSSDNTRQQFEILKENNPYGQDVKYVDVPSNISSEQEVIQILRSHIGTGFIMRPTNGMPMQCSSYISCFMQFLVSVKNNALC